MLRLMIGELEDQIILERLSADFTFDVDPTGTEFANYAG
jgi:hypothetical protein